MNEMVKLGCIIDASSSLKSILNIRNEVSSIGISETSFTGGLMP